MTPFLDNMRIAIVKHAETLDIYQLSMDEEPINELLNITQKAFDVLYSRKSYKPDD